MDQLALTVAEACHALRIGRTRLYEEIRDGRLPAHKVGKRTVIRRTDLDKWLAERRGASHHWNLVSHYMLAT